MPHEAALRMAKPPKLRTLRGKNGGTGGASADLFHAFTAPDKTVGDFVGMHPKKTSDLRERQAEDMSEGDELAVAGFDFTGVVREHMHELTQLKIVRVAPDGLAATVMQGGRNGFPIIPAGETQRGVINPKGRRGGVHAGGETPPHTDENLTGDGFGGGFVVENAERDLKSRGLVASGEMEKFIRGIGVR
jgi:hypothetical protein